MEHESPQQMTAVRYDRVGPAAEVLRLEPVDRPEPGPGQVRVRLAVSAVNPADWKRRAGAEGMGPPAGPVVPHDDGVGTVDAVGAGVDQARVGERVWVTFAAFGTPTGTAAQWCVLPAERAFALPAGVADDDAAVVTGIPGLTAHYALHLHGFDPTGTTVLVTGAAGNVGRVAVGLAARAGATVIGTVHGPERAAVARAAGASHVVDVADADLADAVAELTGGQGVHRVVEVDPGQVGLTRATLTPMGGSIVCYGGGSLGPVTVAPFLGSLSWLLVYLMPPAQLTAAAADLTAALAEKALAAPVAAHFGLDAVAQAHDAVQAGAAGRVLVDVP
jgi:NADPH2:quinone reductase